MKRIDRDIPTVLLTGVTGFLGQELLCQLLTETAANVVCLVRAGDDSEASTRIEGLVDRLFGPDSWAIVQPRVTAVRGNVTDSNMGLSRRTLDSLARSITHVIHCAASVRFDL